MFAGVKSHMSGWLSGGIPGLNRNAGTAEGTVVSAETGQEQEPQETPAEGDQVKDDDASRWVSSEYVISMLFFCE